jgi:hypothetical protein
MKKILFGFFAGAMILASCNKVAVDTPVAAENNNAPVLKRQCASYEVLEQQLQADPA